jgi:type VI secretion system secreted protein VgrG
MEKSIKKIIKLSLQHLDLDSEDARSLIYRTGKAESGYKTLQQYGGGPALGFYQMEPATCRDIWENYVMYRPKYRDKLYALGFDDGALEFCLLSNVGLQTALCRLHYRRVPSALPKASNLEAQAKYWKEFYNTELGKGTIEHFIEANS